MTEYLPDNSDSSNVYLDVTDTVTKKKCQLTSWKDLSSPESLLDARQKYRWTGFPCK